MWKIINKCNNTEGLSIPVFIKNGTCFLTAIHIYPDGTIDAWGSFDLSELDEKLNSGWIHPSPGELQQIDAHHLGNCKGLNVEWTHNITTLRETILNAVKRLHQNLGNHTTSTNLHSHKKGNITQPVPVKHDSNGNIIEGEAIYVFAISPAQVVLQTLFIFADQTLRLGSDGEFTDLRSILADFSEGRLSTSAPEGCRITIPDLGSFMPTESDWYLKESERLHEIESILERLTGGPDRIEACRKAFAAYEANPGPATLNALKAAYEAVPEHLRRYCGDMDRKDGAIRRALHEAYDTD